MKMKAFEDEVRKLLRQDGWGFESTVKAIGTVAEAAGVVWDLEELLLNFESEEGFCRITHVDSGDMFPFTKADAEEIIRRYEAWPKLRAIVEKAETAATYTSAKVLRERILAILDGKEGA